MTDASNIELVRAKTIQILADMETDIRRALIGARQVHDDMLIYLLEMALEQNVERAMSLSKRGTKPRNPLLRQ